MDAPFSGEGCRRGDAVRVEVEVDAEVGCCCFCCCCCSCGGDGKFGGDCGCC